VAFPPCLQLLGGDGGGFHVAKGKRRKLESSDFTTRHLSGRSVRVLAFRRRAKRYGATSRLGLRDLSKPDDGTGTRSGESVMVSANLILCGVFQGNL